MFVLKFNNYFLYPIRLLFDIYDLELDFNEYQNRNNIYFIFVLYILIGIITSKQTLCCYANPFTVRESISFILQNIQI